MSLPLIRSQLRVGLLAKLPGLVHFLSCPPPHQLALFHLSPLPVTCTQFVHVHGLLGIHTSPWDELLLDHANCQLRSLPQLSFSLAWASQTNFITVPPVVDITTQIHSNANYGLFFFSIWHIVSLHLYKDCLLY